MKDTFRLISVAILLVILTVELADSSFHAYSGSHLVPSLIYSADTCCHMENPDSLEFNDHGIFYAADIKTGSFSLKNRVLLLFNPCLKTQYISSIWQPPKYC